MRTQFTFYESWYKSVCQLKKKSEQADILLAICHYALYGEEPEISGSPAAIFESIRPTLNIAKRKSENGKKGKAKAKENAIKAEANGSKPETSESNEETSSSNSNSSSNSSSNSNSYRTICLDNNSSLPSVEKSLGRHAARFTPPAVDEVAEYVREKGYHVDPETFVSFYASKGWKVGSSPMKDWKAAVVTWERKDRSSARSDRQQSANPFLDILHDEEAKANGQA